MHALSNGPSHFADLQKGTTVELKCQQWCSKLQLAIECTYHFKDKYPGTFIVWIHVGNAARMEQGFRKIAEHAQILEQDHN